MILSFISIEVDHSSGEILLLNQALMKDHMPKAGSSTGHIISLQIPLFLPSVMKQKTHAAVCTSQHILERIWKHMGNCTVQRHLS